MVFISDTDILGGIDNHKKQKKKKDYFGSKYQKESCVFKIFLNVFHSRPVRDYGISMFVFLVLKVHFSQSQAFNFQKVLGKHALKGPKNSRP